MTMPAHVILTPMAAYHQIVISPAWVPVFFRRRTVAEKALFVMSGLGVGAGLRQGSWDRRIAPVDQHPTFILLLSLHACDFDPGAGLQPLAEYYQARGLSQAGAMARAERRVHRYVSKYRALRDAMQRDGYRSEAASDQIGVAIGRDGGFIKVSQGHHRFVLARVLGLDSVTADVRWIHSDWHRHATGRRKPTTESLMIATQKALDQRL